MSNNATKIKAEILPLCFTRALLFYLRTEKELEENKVRHNDWIENKVIETFQSRVWNWEDVRTLRRGQLKIF